MCRCDGTAGRASAARPPLGSWGRARPPVGVDAVGRLAGVGAVLQGARVCRALCRQQGWSGRGSRLDEIRHRNRAERRSWAPRGTPRHPRYPRAPPAPPGTLPAPPPPGIATPRWGVRAGGAEPLGSPGAGARVHLAGARVRACVFVCACTPVFASACAGVRCVCMQPGRCGHMHVHVRPCLRVPAFAHVCARGGVCTHVFRQVRVCALVYVYSRVFMTCVRARSRQARACVPACACPCVPVCAGSVCPSVRAHTCTFGRACTRVCTGVHTRACLHPGAAGSVQRHHHCRAPRHRGGCQAAGLRPAASSGSRHHLRFPAGSPAAKGLASSRGLTGCQGLAGPSCSAGSWSRAPSPLPEPLCLPGPAGGCSRRRGSGEEAGRQAGCGQLGRGPCRGAGAEAVRWASRGILASSLRRGGSRGLWMRQPAAGCATAEAGSWQTCCLHACLGRGTLLPPRSPACGVPAAGPGRAGAARTGWGEWSRHPPCAHAVGRHHHPASPSVGPSGWRGLPAVAPAGQGVPSLPVTLSRAAPVPSWRKQAGS